MHEYEVIAKPSKMIIEWTMMWWNLIDEYRWEIDISFIWRNKIRVLFHVSMDTTKLLPKQPSHGKLHFSRYTLLTPYMTQIIWPSHDKKGNITLIYGWTKKKLIIIISNTFLQLTLKNLCKHELATPPWKCFFCVLIMP